jgi:SAM-dependent methyltransferase
MKTQTLPYVDYDNFQSGQSLFTVWERGESAQIPAPLSVRRPRYRKIIVRLITKCHPLGARVLSIGAGNGFTEAEMRKEGFDVLATDVSDIALEYCRRKGLKTLKYEFPSESFPAPASFDVIYCDGLLGHLWQSAKGYELCWIRFAKLSYLNSLLIISNDLADVDGMPTLNVTGAPKANFFRPPAGWFLRDAEASGLWRIEKMRLLRYMRRGQLRRREILVLRCLLMNERKEKHNLPDIERRDLGLVE